MFKIESYITPYILAYLDKYFKNFNPANFQVSLWTGGASFNNLDLNLEVLEEEFNLPVTFVSGHIHELRLFVPWTKITYEPIVVNVNTIEITLKLKKENGDSEPGTKSPKQSVPKPNIPKEPEEAPGYVQNLVNKMVTNIRIDCQNVIVKLVEEDIVFTLNVKTASLSPTDGDWKSSFIDLIAPEFTLRRQLSFSDLTVCLDQTNSAGKIEQYLEPLLYKCSFDIRILQQYYNQFASRPFFTRMDLYSEELKFTITDDQIPMLLKLYRMILAVKTNLKTPSTQIMDPVGVNAENSGGEMGEILGDEEEDPVDSWATWAVGWVPDISGAIFGVDEDGDILDEVDPASVTSHIGFYANKVSIVFKGMEAVTEQKNSHGAPRVKFQPFLKCCIQGIVCDMIQRGPGSNMFAGISQIIVEGVQTCPCGMRDCFDDKSKEMRNNEYLQIGEVNRDFASTGLFENGTVVRPPEDTLFQFDRHVEIFTEEMMLDRTPAIAVEYLDITGVESNDDFKSHHSTSSSDGIDLGRDKLLCRLVVAPCKVKVCSGSIHRIKMLMFAAQLYEPESPKFYEKFVPAHAGVDPVNSVDFSAIRNMESAFDAYQFTIFRPYIEIIAGDHLDFDQQTHIRAKYKKRKATTITPLSDALPEWPKMILTFSCIDGRATDPNMRFKRLIKKTDNFPSNILELFTYKLNTKVFSAEVKLRSDKFIVPICIPFNMEFSYQAAGRPEMWPSKFSPVSNMDVLLDDFRINLAKPHLMLLQVIVASCYDERMSEHLTSTTILRDLPHYNQGDVVLHVQELSFQAVFTRVLHTVRSRVGSLGIFVHSPHHPVPLPIFEGPPQSRPDAEGLAVVIIQYPMQILDEFPYEEVEPEKDNGANDLTPLIIINISEFLVQFEPMFFQWLSYHPRQMPSSIPLSLQTSDQVLYPMVPVSRTSSRLSVGSKGRSNWSTSDDNNPNGSVTGKDFQQLYQSPKASEDTQSISESINSRNFPEAKRKRRRSTLEEEFQLHFSPQVYIETWNKWVVTHLSVIMKSFIIVNIGQGDIWLPVGLKSFVSFHEEGNANGVLITTPRITALSEGPKVNISYSNVPLPVLLPVEYKGRDLYPLRITSENFTLSTVHVKEGRKPFSLPLNILLTLTLSRKKMDGQSALIAAFLHSDIPSIKLSLSFIQINLLLRLTEQFLHTTAVFLNSTGSLMLNPIESNFDADANNRDSVSKRRIDPEIISSRSKEGFAQQHIENISIPETEPPHFSESIASSQQLPPGHIQVESLSQETKASIWMQVTLAQFQLIITNSFHDTDRADQLVFELEDIVSSLDVQSVFVKWSVKVANVSLRNYERATHDRWDVGKCLGVILSGGDEITKHINILRSSKHREHSLSLSASGSSSPVQAPKSNSKSSSSGATYNHSPPKMRGILAFTFTRVQTKNFHKKSELYSPVTRWNTALKKHCDKNKDAFYDEYENEDDRFLSEFDLKVGSVDFLIDLNVLTPYVKVLNAIPSVSVPSKEAPIAVMPVYSNTTLPLIYLETGMVRIFFKSSSVGYDSTCIDTPDVLVLQMSSLTMHSQSENSLHRTVVDKDLYRMAESTNILNIPGSPVEDRQYQVDLTGVLFYTCHWKSIKANSRDLLPSPSSTVLKTMGENPALEWNTIGNDTAHEEAIGHPILESMDVVISYAPAIVYEGDISDTTNLKQILVAGHSLEINVSSEVYIYMHLNQIACMQGINLDFAHMNNECTVSSPLDTKDETIPFNFYRESDSGIDSVITLSTSEQLPGDVLSVKSSEMLAMMKDGTFNKIISPDQIDAVPFDLLVTGSLFQIMTYDLKHKHTKFNGRLKSHIVGMVPLAFFVMGQPHLATSISDTSQRAEVSIFELSIGFATTGKKTLHQFALPDLNDYPDRLFECTPGERDPKTGMIPPFFTAKLTDFKSRPFDFTCDVARPLKISLSRRIIKNLLRIQNYFDSISWKPSPSASTLEADVCTVNNQQLDSAQSLLAKLCFGKISLNQVVFTVIEEGDEYLTRSCAVLSIASCDFSLRSRIKNITTGDTELIVPDRANLELKVCSVTVASGIGARRDIILTPWDVYIKAKLRWKSWLASPGITVSASADPMSIHIGPQNILAYLQLYQTFGKYLLDFISYGQKGIETIMNPSEDKELKLAEDYQDDLRSGNFRYVQRDNASDLPEVYQIAFCERDRTMTWRYPHRRCLTRVESSPVPIDSDLVPSIKNKELPCIIEYLDDAQNKFCHYGIIYLSESSRSSVHTPDKDKFHLFTSSVWRVVIQVPLNETDSFNLVKPEILAATLRVDSLQDSALNPTFKMYAEVPKISVNFVNHLTYAGKTPDAVLKCYSFGGLTLSDQPFASLELTMNTLLVSLWPLKCKMDLNTFLTLSVTEYSYLTSAAVMDPFNLHLIYNVSQKSVAENKAQVKLHMSTKPVAVKVSAPILHSIIASLATWAQVLETYDGDLVDFTSFKSKKLIHLAELLICNDLHADILVNQMKSGKDTKLASADMVQSIGCRECFAFVWPTQKATSTCKISVRDPDWKASDILSFYSVGLKVINIPKSSHKLFINVKKLSASQKLVTISGPFSVVNAMDEVIEIALLPKSGGREVTWPVQSRSHGPSRLIDVDSIEHFRFRYASENSTLPWSPVVTVADMKKGKNCCACLELYREDENGKIKTYSMWCSFVEEKIENTLRCIVVISPFFRVRSSIPEPTRVHNSIGRNLPDEVFELQGEGSEQQIDFVGSPQVVHHLTFQSSPNVSQSSPPIPLVPGGPLTEKVVMSRPIDEITRDIVESLNAENKRKQQATKEDEWPYISDDVVLSDWVECAQPDTLVEVGFSPWIEGLPTVLVDVKPWALFVNITGHSINFTEIVDVENVEFVIPSCSVFTPPKIKGCFKLGFESQSQIWWSDELEFTEQKSRMDVHNVNSNSRIPLDSFSRIEIPGKNEICYITLEARIRKDILVLTMRATFVIQNKTEAWLLVKGISLKENKAQGSSDWTDIKSFTLLDPDLRNVIKSSELGNFTPLLIHYSDTTTENTDNLDDEEENAMKYLGLNCGGPWWFVQLIKFDLMFNNMSASDGLPGKRTAVVIPKYSPIHQRDFHDTKLGNIEDASLPLILSWTAKNGQVWISLSSDRQPQMTLFNLTNRPLFCAQSSVIANIPIPETENFDQYSFIPPNTRSYYTFPNFYSKFPLMSTDTALLPSVMLAALPDRPKKTQKSITDTFGFFQENNLIFSGVFEWSKPIRVDGPVQSVQIVDILGVKVTVEQIGHRRNIYIENLSSVEVSAKDIRHRISGFNSSTVNANYKMHEENITEGAGKSGFNGERKVRFSRGSISEGANILEDTRIICNQSETTASDGTIYSPIEFTVYIPWLRVIILNSLNESGKQQEVLSVSFQDLLCEKFCEVKHIKLRSLDNEELQNWIVRLSLGDLEIDTPPFEDKKSDFAVILRQEADYIPLFAPPNEGFDLYTDQPLNVPNRCIIVATASYGMISSIEQELQKISVQLEPINVFVEKHLIEDVIPVVGDIFSVFDDRVRQISNALTFASAEPVLSQHEALSRTSLGSFSNAKLIMQKGIFLNRSILSRRLVSPTHASRMQLKKSLLFTFPNDLKEITDEIARNRKCALVGERKTVRINSEVQYKQVSENEQSHTKNKISFNSSDQKLRNENETGSGSNPTGGVVESILKENLSCESTNSVSLQQSQEVVSDVQNETDQSPSQHLADDLEMEMATQQQYSECFINSTTDIESILQEFAEPLRLQHVYISPLKIYGSVRFKYGMYLAFDRAPVDVKEFLRNSIITTHYGMGHTLGQHYWQSIIYGYKNVVTGVGSWEGVGSPTRLVGEVSTGLRDFVVYPYQGIFKGPTGFFVGIGKGCSSMVKHIAAGTLSSVTNGAWTWSRNLDALTQDDEDRRVDVHGVADGIAQGFASLGVRMLGAVGGIAHYPIQSIINDGASPRNIAAGVAKGVVSVVTKPVGGALELLAMTGEGILKGTGWSHDNKTKFKPTSEDIEVAGNSHLKYHTKVIREEHEERILLIVDASQPDLTNTVLSPVTLVVTTENLYVFSTLTDDLTIQFPLCKLTVAPSQDRNLLCLRVVTHKLDEYSLTEERVFDFVRGYASSQSLNAINDLSSSELTEVTQPNEKLYSRCNADEFGNFLVDCNSKVEFTNVLNWAKRVINGEFYRSN